MLPSVLAYIVNPPPQRSTEFSSFAYSFLYYSFIKYVLLKNLLCKISVIHKYDSSEKCVHIYNKEHPFKYATLIRRQEKETMQ